MRQQQIGKDDHSEWEASIVRDLDYIKQHKRYRWNAKLRTPLLVYAMLYLLIVLLLIMGLPQTKTELSRRFIGSIMVPLISTFVFGVSIYRYLQSLKFIALTTGFNKQRNLDLLISFLNQKQLLVYYHPGTKDVVQIISRNINPEREQREVLVFVLDENSILINSHFTESGWRLTTASRHDKAMAQDLMAYIHRYKNQHETAIL